MATPAITLSVNITEKKVGASATIAASESTATVDVSRYTRMKAFAVVASFGTGNITLTPQTSTDGGTTWVTLGTAATLTADGTTQIVGASGLPMDVSADSLVRFTRGGDSNVGTVAVKFVAANTFAL